MPSDFFTLQIEVVHGTSGYIFGPLHKLPFSILNPINIIQFSQLQVMATLLQNIFFPHILFDTSMEQKKDKYWPHEVMALNHKVWYWMSRAEIIYGTVILISRMDDGTQVLYIKVQGWE